MKQAFQIDNLLTKKQKLDRRLKFTRFVESWFNRKTLAALAWGFIIGALIGVYIADNPQKSTVASPKPLGQTIEVKEVKALETPHCFDPITCIRDVGEELGVPNKDILTMIRIARAESNFRADAKNPNSTATGIFQIIIGTWDSNRCEGERWDYQDNIRCAYKLYQRRGFQPWDASKHIWNK